MSQASPSVVLVHGALTDASIWHPVIAELHKHGHQVSAPALTMHSLAADVPTCAVSSTRWTVRS